MKKTLILALSLALSVSCLFTGCGGNDAPKTDGNTPAPTEEKTDLLTDIKAGDREYGKTYDLTQSDTMSGAFFDLNINSAKLVSELEGYTPVSETDKFLILNVTIKNTFADPEGIPMYEADFEVDWDGAEQTVYPDSEFTDALPAEYNIPENTSKTGNLVFVVPGDKTEFVLKYHDLWDDQLEGNHYNMTFTAEAE